MSIFDQIRRLSLPSRHRSTPAPNDTEQRADAYAGASSASIFNTINGVGSTADKGAAARVGRPSPLTDQELTTLTRYNWIASVICGELPSDALATGFELRDGEVLEDERFERWGIKIREASTLARTYGGALLLVYVDDNRDTDEEVGDSQGILSVIVADRRELAPLTWIDDVTSDEYGLPETYLYQPVRGNSSVWHHSRTVRFVGKPLPRREAEENEGWGDSVLQIVWEQIGQFALIASSVAHVVSEYKYPVYKMTGLAEAMMGPSCEADIQARFSITNTLKGMLNAVVISSDEELENRITPLTGLPEVMDRFGRLMAAASRMPQTKFFGDSPQGLGSANESGEREWEKQVMTYKREVLIPAVRQLLALEPDLRDRGIAIKPLPMRVPTPAEQATIDKQKAERAAILVQAQVLSPEAIAKTLADEFDVELNAPDFGAEPGDAARDDAER